MNAPARIAKGAPLTASLFAVEGMRCAACIARIEGGLVKVPGVAAARVNLSARTVRVDHAGVAEDALIAAFAEAGFTAFPYAAAPDHGGRVAAEARELRLALAVAGFAAMNVMLLSVSVWAGAEGMTRDLFHWISALIAMPTVAYAGRPFFRSAWGALRQRRANMDVPIAIGVVGTVAMSLYETIIGAPHAYFDGAVMLLFFLLGGRYLDSVMRARAEESVAALLRRVPHEASVAVAGRIERRAAAMIAPGDRVLVAAGERIAVDGTLEQGTSAVDASLVTGESLPQPVAPGALLLAGTVNLVAPIWLTVTKSGDDTAIAEIARAMADAGQSRSRYVRIADRASQLYAPAVHSLAALTLLWWLASGAGLHQSLLVAVAVLIITCPCALGLAVPVSQVVAAGALMRAGVLVKDGSALERLAEADTALFDKTGTVTLGDPEPHGLPDHPAERARLAALARASRHPLARAIAGALPDAPAAATDLVEEPGLGVEATIDGRRWRLGRPDWLGLDAPAHSSTAFGPVDAPGAARRIDFTDHLRPDAREAMRAIEALGLSAQLLSGDSPRAVAAAADALGIAGEARVTPTGKDARVQALAEEGRRVLMVGDGLNDGPALRRAHVAMAPARASDVGQMAADLLFFGDELAAVPRAIRAARATMRIVRQNFALAVGYNALAVPLAMMGKVTPLVAALAMSGSSILVVANALRLTRAAR